MYDVGWLADFADPDNFCEPYQASWGAFMYGQIDPSVNAQPTDQAFVDQEISDAMVEPNFVTRGNMYKDLQQRYWTDVPSFCLVQAQGRRFARDWVRGWYYNSLYPGGYYYDIYKQVVSNPLVDVDATSTITPGPGTTYPVTEIFNGGMYLGFYGGTAHFQTRTDMNYSLHAVYALRGAQPTLLVARE
jgi:ABC-type transport system substrate-binding protein